MTSSTVYSDGYDYFHSSHLWEEAKDWLEALDPTYEAGVATRLGFDSGYHYPNGVDFDYFKTSIGGTYVDYAALDRAWQRYLA